LDLNLVIPEDPDYIMVHLCIRYLDRGYSLRKECMESLNVIYKKYA